MAKCPRVAKWRKQLLRSCKVFVSQIIETEPTRSVGTANAEDFTGNKITYTSAASLDYETIISDIKVHIHGLIIQEWLFFLKHIFKEAILFYLKNGDSSKLPSINLKLNKLKPTRRITEMRESICSVVMESFSFLPYDQTIDILEKLFTTNEIRNDLKSEMKKHIEIRNIFEHNRGKVRETDLAKIGQPANGYFEIVDEQGNIKKYKRGDTIILSKAEIQNLHEIIRQYSKKLDVLC